MHTDHTYRPYVYIHAHTHTCINTSCTKHTYTRTHVRMYIRSVRHDLALMSTTRAAIISRLQGTEGTVYDLRVLQERDRDAYLAVKSYLSALRRRVAFVIRAKRDRQRASRMVHWWMHRARVRTAVRQASGARVAALLASTVRLWKDRIGRIAQMKAWEGRQATLSAKFWGGKIRVWQLHTKRHALWAWRDASRKKHGVRMLVDIGLSGRWHLLPKIVRAPHGASVRRRAALATCMKTWRVRAARCLRKARISTRTQAKLVHKRLKASLTAWAAACRRRTWQPLALARLHMLVLRTLCAAFHAWRGESVRNIAHHATLARLRAHTWPYLHASRAGSRLAASAFYEWQATASRAKAVQKLRSRTLATHAAHALAVWSCVCRRTKAVATCAVMATLIDRQTRLLLRGLFDQWRSVAYAHARTRMVVLCAAKRRHSAGCCSVLHAWRMRMRLCRRAEDLLKVCVVVHMSV
jgi:hypothetical protein